MTNTTHNGEFLVSLLLLLLSSERVAASEFELTSLCHTLPFVLAFSFVSLRSKGSAPAKSRPVSRTSTPGYTSPGVSSTSPARKPASPSASRLRGSTSSWYVRFGSLQRASNIRCFETSVLQRQQYKGSDLLGSLCIPRPEKLTERYGDQKRQYQKRGSYPTER